MKSYAIAAALLAFATVSAHAATPLTHVAIYRGPAGCEDCSESVKRALLRLDPTYQIDFVGADEVDLVSRVETQQCPFHAFRTVLAARRAAVDRHMGEGCGGVRRHCGKRQ